ncbi:succinate--CoA ligase [GDP-forming] subunit beta, mitochondrial [Elysia marginata]|uniref:Succinyl-CoA synthetase beta chain n=1 Tax=Elysia marginata TaxID=1093978 RepID=A0AAV4FXV2_9GAST|nr:succinate--CoA ligase [GDP-forming] subunit beta, mitochondrial [Elysia marginata]
MAALSFMRSARLARFAKQKLPALSQARHLNLQEFQSKKLMADGGINVQLFEVVGNEQEAATVASKLKVQEYVVKAQILAGGRGKGTFDTGFKGGVHLTKQPSEVKPLVDSMLGHKLTTKQTPKGGVQVTKVPVDILEGVQQDQVMFMAEKLGFTGPKQSEAAEQMRRLYDLFLRVDATQVEINPLGETPDGRVVCFDAKINFDDNAEFRQKPVFAMDDMAESDPREVEASRHNLNYIGMDGNIACLVNGAGLAMATMDIIHLHGGSPANFLDVGGNVTEEQVFHAFKLLTQDKQVKAILVNIFGGIVNCATIANGITNACKSINLSLPLIVRLEGTNVEEAKRILAESNLPISSATDLDDAAKKAVASL